MRLLSFLIISVLLLTVAVADAAPVGNPAKPAILKHGIFLGEKETEFAFAMDPEVDLVFDRRLDDQDGDTEYSFYGSKAGIVLWNKAYIYGIAGVANAEQKFNINGNRLTWDTDHNFTWGAGATLVVYEKPVRIREQAMLRIGVDGRYRHSELDVDNVVLNGTSFVPAEGSSGSSLTSAGFDYNEWQAAVGVSVQFENLVPYAGVKYSEADGHAKATFTTAEYKEDFGADDNFGAFVGADFIVNDSITIYAEGRFIDETAFSGGGTIRF